jgi:transposase InsO family protein
MLKFKAKKKRRLLMYRWRHDYNYLRPHSNLGALTPSEFAALKPEQTTPPRRAK